MSGQYMQGYRISQLTAAKVAAEGFEVYLSPISGFYLRTDEMNSEQIRKYIKNPTATLSIPRDAFRALSGVHLDPLEESIAALSEMCNISYDSLAKAAREGRIEARRSGGIWLSTKRAVENAIKAGTLRPRNRLLPSI